MDKVNRAECGLTSVHSPKLRVVEVVYNKYLGQPLADLALTACSSSAVEVEVPVTLLLVLEWLQIFLTLFLLFCSFSLFNDLHKQATLK